MTPDQSRFTSAHAVQLFDSEESRVDAIADFCHEGVTHDETTLAIVSEERWHAVATRLSARRVAIGDALWRGQLTVRSAERMLKGIMREGRPHLQLMATSLGPLTSRLAAFGKPVRIYGEMVDVLASRGEHAAARELEELWNVLGSQYEYKIFCGYSAAHFREPGTAEEWRRICAAHSEVRFDCGE